MAKSFMPTAKEKLFSVTVRVPLSQKKLLDQMAESTGRSVSEVAAEAIGFALENVGQPKRRARSAPAGEPSGQSALV